MFRFPRVTSLFLVSLVCAPFGPAVVHAGDVVGRVELTEKEATVTFRAVGDALVSGSPVTDLAKFVVEAGDPGLKRA